MNTVTVKINGTEYPLKGEENAEYLLKLAKYVDRKVKKLIENNSSLSTASASVLTAINVADDMFKLQAACDELNNKLDLCKDSERDLNEQIEALKKQIKHMEKHNDELQQKINVLEKDDPAKQSQKQIKDLNIELDIMQETAKMHFEEKDRLTIENREMRFQLQSAKYKIIDLQNRLLDNQIDLVKAKRSKNILQK